MAWNEKEHLKLNNNMKIIFSKDVDGESFRIEANDDESGVEGIKTLAHNFHEQMQHAYDAAHSIWEYFPEFKQLTFDTLTDKERRVIGSMKEIREGMN